MLASGLGYKKPSCTHAFPTGKGKIQQECHNASEPTSLSCSCLRWVKHWVKEVAGRFHGIEGCEPLGLAFYLPDCLGPYLPVATSRTHWAKGLPTQGPFPGWCCLVDGSWIRQGYEAHRTKAGMFLGPSLTTGRDPTSLEPTPQGRKTSSNWGTWDHAGKTVRGQDHGGSSKSCFSYYFSLLTKTE